MLFCEIENKSQKTPKDLIMPLLEENDIKCGKDFSSATEVNESFLSRIRNESSPKFDYEIVLAICVGMRAGLSRTIEILDAFGYSFRKDIQSRAIFFSMVCSYSSIHEVNAFLNKMNLPTLGSRQYKK